MANFGLICVTGGFDSSSTYITFVLYLALLVGVGVYFSKRNKNLTDYLLGGRGMGSWVTALSAQASDMSSWLLMGLPGALFMAGMGEMWVAIGLVLGTFLNWLIIAPRLRNYTSAEEALTLPSFFKRRFAEPYNLLSICSTLFILLFFTIYTASGLKGTGVLFVTTFNLDYHTAIIIGAAVMVFYTLLGGFLAVCWTDLFQGILMFFAIAVLPIIAICHLQPGEFSTALEAKNISLSIFDVNTNGNALLYIISTAAWGLGYFGQPHILARFMSIKSIKLLPKTVTIAMSWVVVSLAGAVAVGLVAIPLYPEITTSAQAEEVFMMMIKQFLPASLAGIFLSAIMAAAMSTIDSQLLVSSSSLTEDIYVNLIRPKATVSEQLWISRGCVFIIAIIACVMAWDKESTIFGLVKLAWSGFGSAFGPVVIMALYSRKTGWVGALSGMLVGALVWWGWSSVASSPSLQEMLPVSVADFIKGMYEIVPAFIANMATIMIVNSFAPNRSEAIANKFDLVVNSVKNKEDL